MTEKIRLTQYSKTSGWAAKLGPKALSQVLRQVSFVNEDTNLLVGIETGDDAAVYKLDDEKALIQTLDFFTPVVDDPYIYGQIAAANSLSDIYAMGGKPILAMNIVGFPECLEQKLLVDILQGGADKIKEAEASLVGGHTVKDDEPKYGLAVAGLVHPDNLITNSTAKPNDKLILTKPLGTGIMISAIKGGLENGDIKNPAVKSMIELNDKPVEVFKKYKINSCTDITGFGLIGHLTEMVKASNIQININTNQIPIFNKVIDYTEMGLYPEGGYSNRENYQEMVNKKDHVEEIIEDILYDPQTSGGLLLSVSDQISEEVLDMLHSLGVEDAAIIGDVKKGNQEIILS